MDSNGRRKPARFAARHTQFPCKALEFIASKMHLARSWNDPVRVCPSANEEVFPVDRNWGSAFGY